MSASSSCMDVPQANERRVEGGGGEDPGGGEGDPGNAPVGHDGVHHQSILGRLSLDQLN